MNTASNTAMSGIDPASNGVVVTINVPPALEEVIVDWLLARDSVTGFTSYRAYGHASAHDHLSIAEQVSGRQRRLEFRVALPEAALDVFLSDLADRFSGADLFYVATPVLRSAHLGAAIGATSGTAAGTVVDITHVTDL